MGPVLSRLRQMGKAAPLDGPRRRLPGLFDLPRVEPRRDIAAKPDADPVRRLNARVSGDVAVFERFGRLGSSCCSGTAVPPPDAEPASVSAARKPHRIDRFIAASDSLWSRQRVMSRRACGCNAGMRLDTEFARNGAERNGERAQSMMMTPPVARPTAAKALPAAAGLALVALGFYLAVVARATGLRRDRRRGRARAPARSPVRAPVFHGASCRRRRGLRDFCVSAQRRARLLAIAGTLGGRVPRQ